MMKYSIAVLALLYGAQAIRFAGDTEDEDAMTLASIKEAEKIHGSKLPELGAADVKSALAENNHIHFDGDTLTKVTLQPFETHKQYPGVTFLALDSDPIHGSLGPPAVDIHDLTPEQAFEENLRRKKAQVFQDEKDSTVETRESIDTAEKLTGQRMADPRDAKEEKRIEEAPEYHLHTADEEDEDTKETRRSVKTIEKREKRRFWINAKEERDFRKAVAAGKVNPKQLTFEEGKDEDIGEPDKVDEQRQKDKAAAKAKKDKEAEEDKNLTEGEKAEKKKEAATAEADAKAKEVTPEEKEADEKAAKKKEEKAAAADELPPELAGAAIQIKMEQYGVRADYTNVLY